jgi:hypothetical protein
MNLPFTCRSCGEASSVAWSQIGQRVACSGCGATATVPPPKETLGAENSSPPALRFACPVCGRKFATKPDLAGKKIRCSGCGAGVRVPGANGAPAPKSGANLSTTESTSPKPRPNPARVGVANGSSRSAAEPALADSSTLIEDLASIEGSDRPRRAEPVLPSRSQMIEAAREHTGPESAPQEPKAPRAKKKGKKKKKKKKTGYFDLKETLQLVAGVSGLVVVLAFLAWRFPGFRFPVGGFLCVTGFIVYLMGAFSLRQLVAEEGVVQALLFRFFPPYQWWFIASRWDDAKDFAAFFAAGIVAMAIGGGIIKTSPIGKKAEESERAFQKAQQHQRADVQQIKTDGPPVNLRLPQETE